MRRVIRLLLMLVAALVLLIAVLLAFSGGARRLAPTWLYYELLGRQVLQLPAGAEQRVIADGQDFCSVGRDSACGGYKLVNAHALAIGAAARQRGAVAAWCVDYVVLRRNTGRLTGELFYWSYIPGALVVAELNSGQFESFPIQRCDLATFEQ